MVWQRMRKSDREQRGFKCTKSRNLWKVEKSRRIAKHIIREKKWHEQKNANNETQSPKKANQKVLLRSKKNKNK